MKKFSSNKITIKKKKKYICMSWQKNKEGMTIRSLKVIEKKIHKLLIKIFLFNLMMKTNHLNKKIHHLLSEK